MMNNRIGELLIRPNEHVHTNSTYNTKTIVYFTDSDDFWTERVLAFVGKILGPTWNIRVFKSKRCKDSMRFASWDISVSTVKIARFSDENYNHFIKSPSFWKALPEEHVLLLPPFSIIVRDIPTPLLVCDYIGLHDGKCKRSIGLRRKSSMLKMLADMTNDPSVSEHLSTYTYMKNDPNYNVCELKPFVEVGADVIGMQGLDQCIMSSEQYRTATKHLG